MNSANSKCLELTTAGTPAVRQLRFISRHLNKLRWLCLWTVFLLLVFIPVFHLYQTQAASYSYDLLSPAEQTVYDTTEWVASHFSRDPAKDLDNLKGNTWSGVLFGLPLSDPLAVLSQIFASYIVYWPVVVTAMIPLLLTLLLGRVFCGWICPATLLYELNDNLKTWLTKFNIFSPNRQLDRRIKYAVLVSVLVLCGISGSVITAAIYPPAVLGRELYYAIALGGFSTGMLFFLATLLFDLMVAKRGFCRYLCPGGALFSLLGRFRLVRIQRDVQQCNDCTKCNAACQFGLTPMLDGFGQECNNCTACIASCPNDALQLTVTFQDQQYRGPGHLGRTFKQSFLKQPGTPAKGSAYE